jgi:hypothetical protein
MVNDPSLLKLYMRKRIFTTTNVISKLTFVGKYTCRRGMKIGRAE